ncbi:MAG: hypothetical protein KAT00_14760, partial [Planctomycetes bacterium]|nr:hypothetical protein [Planctomycetota bacterium]
MSGNDAGDRGGAVACLDNSHSEIVNCLITDNHAVGNGGGVFFRNSYGIVNLTTIVENVSDNEGRGGIAGRNQGQNLGANRITVTNSIVWNNGILGDNIDDLWSDPATMMDATFTCSGNAGDVTAQNDNISEDPMFVDGPLGNFYLYHPVSDCINAGEGAGVFSTILNTYNLDGDITTDPESSPGSLNDLRSIDMGYHYKPFAGVRMQRLEIHVVNDLGGVEYSARFGSWPDPSQYVNGGGIATYGNPIVMYFPQGTYVNLTAIPDPGYRISSWQGSGNDAQLGNFNYVYIGNTDAVITVEFEVKHTNIIHVPGVAPFIGIQGAIDIARDGDIIIIAQGIYVGTDFVVSGKDITITGTAPEKPEIVAQTVINCSGGHRGFTLLGTGQGSCTLRGLTIVNAGGGGSKIPSTPNRPGGTDGLDAGLNMGAGVYVSGPHIVADCVIRSCYVGGTEGQDGTNGQYPPGNPGHEAHGGSGGKGGTVAGGGIYVSWGSAQILRCTIDGCLIRGGRGADGSNGASGSDN